MKLWMYLHVSVDEDYETALVVAETVEDAIDTLRSFLSVVKDTHSAYADERNLWEETDMDVAEVTSRVVMWRRS